MTKDGALDLHCVCVCECESALLSSRLRQQSLHMEQAHGSSLKPVFSTQQIGAEGTCGVISGVSAEPPDHYSHSLTYKLLFLCWRI